MKRLLALILLVMSGAALAQTTGALNPSTTPVEPSVTEEVPPGGCMPIGLTASGEIVFPIQCKAFIDRHRGMAVEQKPAAVEEQRPAAVGERKSAVIEEKKPAAVEEQKSAVIEENKPAAVEEKKPAAVEEKTAAKQSEEVAPENIKPANKPVEPAPLPKRVEREPRHRATSADGCHRYRTYDPESRTYRGYDGRVRSCR